MRPLRGLLRNWPLKLAALALSVLLWSLTRDASARRRPLATQATVQSPPPCDTLPARR